MRRKTSVWLWAAAICLAGGAVVAQQPTTPYATGHSGPVKVATRRLTESQYRNTIRDAFGPEIVINARFEPEKREDGLLAVGSTQLSITTAGLEQYLALAKSVSEQALDPKRRDAVVGCKPADEKKPDDACARQFIAKYGEALFRRPLTDKDMAARLKSASYGAAQTGDFYGGLKLALTSMLIAPEFMFRVETAEPDPAHPGQYRLDGYTRAERLSYLFWDTAPDAELREAAASGALQSDAGLKHQIARLSTSPRLADGARAFFTDMLQFDQFDSLSKDPATYPKFSQAVADGAREQTLKTIIDLLVTKKRDYRDIFVSNETFLNRDLAAVYKAPFKSDDAWAPYTFPAQSERAGVLTQISFLSLFSHPGASSPTKRGVKVNEIFLCLPTPDPPPNVDFSKVQALDKGTVRIRLLDHMQNAGCASCHKRSDPPGLALEHFDGAGQQRTLENGAPIDVSAELDGKTFSGSAGLGAMMHDHKRVPACLVKNVFAYGVGRAASDDDEDYLAAQTSAFAKAGYRLPDLMAQIAASPEFLKPAIPKGIVASAAPAAMAALKPETPQGAVR